MCRAAPPSTEFSHKNGKWFYVEPHTNHPWPGRRRYDSSGNLITKDEDYTDHCVARWTPTPKWTGKFTIKIKNRGGVPNSYVMTTN